MKQSFNNTSRYYNFLILSLNTQRRQLAKKDNKSLVHLMKKHKIQLSEAYEQMLAAALATDFWRTQKMNKRS